MPLILPPEFRLPPVQSWYLLCRSTDLRCRRLLSREIGGQAIVLFRGEGGEAHALSARCAHLGTHLGQGRVVGDHLQCPLHHWEYDGAGTCRRVPGHEPPPPGVCQAAFPLAERYGGIFVFSGPRALFPPPAFSAELEPHLTTGFGQPVRLRCPWFVATANGFDLQHLEAAHQRVLVGSPLLTQPERYRIQLRCVFQVAGQSLTDRVMRRLSRNRISVSITCWGGTVVLVESDLGWTRSALLFGTLPTAYGCEVIPLFGVMRSGFKFIDAISVSIARWLFGGFLKRDVAVLDDILFQPHLIYPADECLGRFLEYLCGLPVMG